MNTTNHTLWAIFAGILTGLIIALAFWLAPPVLAVDIVYDQSFVSTDDNYSNPFSWISYSAGTNIIDLGGSDTLYLSVDDGSCTGNKTFFVQAIIDDVGYNTNSIALPTDPTTVSLSWSTPLPSGELQALNSAWDCSSGSPRWYGEYPRPVGDPMLVYTNEPNFALWFYTTGTLSATADPYIYVPDDLMTIAQSEINASGALAYYFYVSSGVNATTWTDESYRYQIELYDEISELYCLMDNGFATSNTINGTEYSTTLNHKVDGEPFPCDNFSKQDYTARTRVSDDNGVSWSAWSDYIAYTVGDSSFAYSGTIDCPDDPSILSLCWWYNLLVFLLEPSQNATDYILEVLSMFEYIFPFSWLYAFGDLFFDAMQTATIDLGATDGGNPLENRAPNFAWLAENIKMFYGDWAGALSAFIIWFGAFVAVVKAGYAIFRLNDSIPIDTE